MHAISFTRVDINAIACEKRRVNGHEDGTSQICPSKRQRRLCQMPREESEMTYEQKRRVIEAIAECDRVLSRARSYMEKHQDRDLIAAYEAQKAKLQGMLE